MRRFLLTIATIAMLAPASAAPLGSEYFELPRGDYPHDVAIADIQLKHLGTRARRRHIFEAVCRARRQTVKRA